jgi:cold shock CspA family protein/uncharacterized LabA/DUF88 family protein
MTPDSESKLLRLAVFYDGNFFYHVSTYYRYAHAQKKRISIPGLHSFIRHHIAKAEGTDVRRCQIVDAHFFRGRFSAKEADARQKLYVERVFDDILMGEGVVTHYLPIRYGAEKGIDVSLALEAFELAVYKRFNVVVLIAGDSDFIPLVRKLNSLGTRVMVLGWDFKFTDDLEQERETITSINLLDEATYPVMMHQIIDDKTRRDDPLIKDLFFEPREPSTANNRMTASPQKSTVSTPDTPQAGEADGNTGERYDGEVQNIKEGYGFIRSAAFPNNVFFHWSAVANKEFTDLKIKQKVSFSVQNGPRGQTAVNVEVIE